MEYLVDDQVKSSQSQNMSSPSFSRRHQRLATTPAAPLAMIHHRQGTAQLSPATVRKIEHGAKAIVGFYSAIQNRDVFGAYNAITTLVSGQQEDQQEQEADDRILDTESAYTDDLESIDCESPVHDRPASGLSATLGSMPERAGHIDRRHRPRSLIKFNRNDSLESFNRPRLLRDRSHASLSSSRNEETEPPVDCASNQPQPNVSDQADELRKRQQAAREKQENALRKFLMQMDEFVEAFTPEAETASSLLSPVRQRVTTTLFSLVGNSALGGAAKTLLPSALLPTAHEQVLSNVQKLKQELSELLKEIQPASETETSNAANASSGNVIPLPPPPPPPLPSSVSMTLPMPRDCSPPKATSMQQQIAALAMKKSASRTSIHSMMIDGQAHVTAPETNIGAALQARFKQDGKPMLRQTGFRRSPGGTPMRSQSPTPRVKGDLFQGLRDKFKAIRQLNAANDNDEDDDDDDDDQPSPMPHRRSSTIHVTPNSHLALKRTPASLSSSTSPLIDKRTIPPQPFEATIAANEMVQQDAHGQSDARDSSSATPTDPKVPNPASKLAQILTWSPTKEKRSVIGAISSAELTPSSPTKATSPATVDGDQLEFDVDSNNSPTNRVKAAAAKFMHAVKPSSRSSSGNSTKMTWRNGRQTQRRSPSRLRSSVLEVFESPTASPEASPSKNIDQLRL